MDSNPLLDTYLRQLRLPTFLKYYTQFASDAARNNEDPVRFLLALAEQEVNQRQQNMLQQRLKMARFPVIKELPAFAQQGPSP
jgi:DNA replication protein DnaC